MSALTDKEQEQILHASRIWFTRGHPEKSDILKRHLEEGTMPPVALLAFGQLRPEVSNASFSDEDIPPRHGKGSSTKAWQEFLMKFTTMDKDVVAALSRDDCVRIAEEKGIIPPEYGEKKDAV